jgi:hypothetical protein
MRPKHRWCCAGRQARAQGLARGRAGRARSAGEGAEQPAPSLNSSLWWSNWPADLVGTPWAILSARGVGRHHDVVGRNSGDPSARTAAAPPEDRRLKTVQCRSAPARAPEGCSGGRETVLATERTEADFRAFPALRPAFPSRHKFLLHKGLGRRSPTGNRASW